MIPERIKLKKNNILFIGYDDCGLEFLFIRMPAAFGLII